PSSTGRPSTPWGCRRSACASEPALRGGAFAERLAVGSGGRGGSAGRVDLGVGWLRALAGPLLVELHPPFALLALAEGEAGPERAAAAPAKARDGARGVAALDQLPCDGDRQRLARLGLPDHEAAAGILARPAR